MIKKKKSRRVYTFCREEHQAVRRAVLDSGVTIMSGSTTSAFYVPSIQTKYVPHWMCRDWHGVPRLAGEIARFELDRQFVDLKKIKNWRGNHIKLLHLRWPMFSQEPYIGPLTYFDLIGAYWQFYGKMWLDVGYPCGYGSLDLAPIAETLKDLKAARNAVIGITRSTKVMMQNRNRTFSVKSKNRFLSPPLWANLMGWLQEIAAEAIRRGAIYCMMDGFLFPQGSDFDGFQSFLDDYQIKYRKKSGLGHIKGWGSYSTDFGKTTHLFEKGARGKVNTVKQHFAEPHKILKWWVGSIDFRIWRYENGNARFTRQPIATPIGTV